MEYEQHLADHHTPEEYVKQLWQLYEDRVEERDMYARRAAQYQVLTGLTWIILIPLWLLG